MRRLVVVVFFSSLVVPSGCGDSSLPPVVDECTLGATKCDGVKLVSCSKDPNDALRWGPATACPDKQECKDTKCQAACVDGAACDDGDACTTNDTCASGVCQGSLMVCDSPPANTCKDANTLSAYSANGVCQGGSCSYPSADVTCPLGCDDTAGACKGDPCQTVTCDQPPGECFKDTGICSGGQCFYNYDDGKVCDDSDPCTGGDQCLGGVCVGVAKVCDSPPAGSCKDANTLTIYEKQGSCSGGTCTYPVKDVACSHGCDSATATCKTDPCDTVTCTTPPNTCYISPGTCADGKCTYQEDNGKTCDDSNPCTTGDTCTTGVCKGSAVICNTPPANKCKDATILTVYTAPGLCSGGTCTYGSADVSCPFGCDTVNKVCKGDPCATLTCDTPPNTQCYTVPGICSSGTCTYLPKSGASCNDNNPCTKTDLCSSAGACAGTAYTCNDNLTCTTNTCNGLGGCTYPLMSNYCLLTINYAKTCYAGNALNPSNACEICSPATSTSVWSTVSGTPIVSYGFDSGNLQGFTVTPSPATSPVKWQVDNYRSASAPYSLYFGNPLNHNFNDPGKAVKGEATSPGIALPAGLGKLCLKFQLFKDTEPTYYDLLWVTVLPAGTTIWEAVKEPNFGLTKVFIPVAADLTAFAGQTVQFRFNFDSKDSIGNSGEGVYVDDIQVMTSCTP